MKELDELITEIEAVENMYLDKKHILKRLKAISKENKPEIKDVVICNRVNRTDNNRCINCGAKSGHECQMKTNKSDYC